MAIDIITANAYFNTRVDGITWTMATQDAKNRALRTADRVLQSLAYNPPLPAVRPVWYENAVFEEAYMYLTGHTPEEQLRLYLLESESVAGNKQVFDHRRHHPGIQSGVMSFQAWNIILPYLKDLRAFT